MKVVVIDHYTLFYEGIKSVLHTNSEISVVAGTDDISMLEFLIASTDVDIIVMDIDIFISEKATLKKMLAPYQIKLILMATDQLINIVDNMVDFDIHGFLCKNMDLASFVHAIKSVYKGEYYYHHQLIKELFDRYHVLLEKSKKSKTKPPHHLLTKRQYEILQLLTIGNSNRDIAEHLYISEKTVKNHVSSLFKKLAVEDRTQAVVMAIQNSWVEF